MNKSVLPNNKKNIIIIHGTGETPEYMWLPWVKKHLEEKGYNVSVPQLPNTDDPKLEEQLDFCLKNMKFDPETIVIGHSSGCPLILAILEKIPVKIKQAILVAGYSVQLGTDPEGTKNIKENYDWDRIKGRCDEFVFLNSDNDPWGCDDKQGKAMQKELGGKFILMRGQGHMGSSFFNEPYMEFPLLLELVD